MMDQDVDVRAAGAPESEENGAADRLSALESELSEAQAALERSERERALDRALGEAGAIDMETARLLAERVMGDGEESDAASAVEEVKRRKPFLFRSARAGAYGAMGAAPEERGAIDSAAHEAARSGDRGSLLKYLRLRRERRGAAG